MTVEKENVVYFIKQSDYIKIGVSSNIRNRMNHYKTHSPYGFEEIAHFAYSSKSEMQNAEKWFHSLFWHYHHRGEWFWYKPIINWLYSTDEERMWLIFKRVTLNEKLDIYDDSFRYFWLNCGYEFWRGDETISESLHIIPTYCTDEQLERFEREDKEYEIEQSLSLAM